VDLSDRNSAPSVPSVEPRIGRSVSIDQAATLLRVSRRTVYNRIREGRLKTIRTIGGSQRVLCESMLTLNGAMPVPARTDRGGMHQ
jgi:excisionase family DNA binding protein